MNVRIPISNTAYPNQFTASRFTRKTQLFLDCAAKIAVHARPDVPRAVRRVPHSASERLGDDTAEQEERSALVL